MSGKYYIGMHSTSNLEDGYFGSGKILKRSLNKHGKNNHLIEILEFLEDRSSLKKRENELVNESLINDQMCMNLQLGGEGGAMLPSIIDQAKETKRNRWNTIGLSEKEKASRIITGIKLSNYNKLESTRNNISAKLKGKKKPKFTEEHIKNIGLSSKGRPGPNKKKIMIHDVKYESLHYASKQLMIPVTTIRARLLSSKVSEYCYVN